LLSRFIKSLYQTNILILLSIALGFGNLKYHDILPDSIFFYFDRQQDSLVLELRFHFLHTQKEKSRCGPHNERIKKLALVANGLAGLPASNTDCKLSNSLSLIKGILHRFD
jgi:hypothetical protein